jgi:VID27 C-terminal WD40-like domain
MILMNPSDPHTVYRMDLGERGEIVDEWKIHNDVSIDHMAPNSKFAPTTHTQTFVGASHSGLFRVDPRLSGSKLVDSEFKQYATKAKFSSLATTQLGKIVVASAKGDFRLFDSIGKNAKTALPALGDPIIGVDVTADGKWVVATTKTALLVFDLTIPEGKYAGQLGFDRSFPADKKPLAKRLTLTPQHVAYMGEISFTSARYVLHH